MTDYTDCPLCGEGVDKDALPGLIARYKRAYTVIDDATVEKMCSAHWNREQPGCPFSNLPADIRERFILDMRAALAVLRKKMGEM